MQKQPNLNPTPPVLYIKLQLDHSIHSHNTFKAIKFKYMQRIIYFETSLVIPPHIQQQHSLLWLGTSVSGGTM